MRQFLDGWCGLWSAVDDTFMSINILGTTYRANYMINTFKGLTLPYCVFTMFYFNHWTPTSWIYTALHGSYGIGWVIKDVIFPDRNFQQPRSIFYNCVGAFFLAMYWSGFFLLCSSKTERPLSVLISSILMYNMGALLMFGSDCQKYFILQNKKGLISTGFFYYLRNPNYLGEILIYGSFGLIANSKVFWGWLSFVWFCFFSKNIWAKEKSLKKKDGAKEYFARSYAIIPGLW